MAECWLETSPEIPNYLVNIAFVCKQDHYIKIVRSNSSSYIV